MLKRLIVLLAITMAAGAFAAPAAAQTVRDNEYRFPPSVSDRYIGNYVTEIWAHVFRPVFSGTQRYPLVVMLHGNTNSCVSNSGQPPSDQYALEGNCPPNYSMIQSHMGFEYLARDLAAQGFIVVTISAHRGFPKDATLPLTEDFMQLRARGRLALFHLMLLSEWDRGILPLPPGLEDLRNRIDFNHVGLMGHSRGAVGMRSAINDYRDVPLWRERNPNMRIRALIEIAPAEADFSVNNPAAYDPNNIAFLGLVGLCDGDVPLIQVFKQYDRMIRLNVDNAVYPKALYGIHGANHNYFNFKWLRNDAAAGCINQTQISAQQQRDSALIAVRNFFRANVGANRDPSLSATFDPIFGAPPGPRIDRAFTPSHHAFGETVILDEFTGPQGFNRWGPANNHFGLDSYVHNTGGIEHDHDYPNARISWSGGPGQSWNKFLQVNWAHPGPGWNLGAHHNYLEFRVDQTEGSTVTPEFTVHLVTHNGIGDVISGGVSTSLFVTLLPLPGSTLEGSPRFHPVMKTVRIPLGSFSGANLSNVRGVRFVFDRTGVGSLMLGSVVLTK